MTVLVPTAIASPAIVNGTLFPILFISGTFFLVDPTSLLGRIAEIFPVAHFERAMLAVFDPRGTGSGITGLSLVVMLGWGLAGLLLALRSFRWEPVRR